MGRTLLILLTSTAILIASPAFAQNRVLSLGEGDYVEIEDSEVLNDIGFQVTMETWIKPTSFAHQWVAIISKTDAQISDYSNRSFALWFNSSGFIHLVSAPEGQRQILLNSPDGLIGLSKWYHLAGVIDAKDGLMRIFINGAEVANGDFPKKELHFSRLPLRIGWTHEENVGTFAAQIDEVRLWNVARTQEQIQATMFTSLSGKEPGLVGYWRFDDEIGTVTDSSPNQIHGRLMGDARIVEAELPKPGELDILTVISGMVRDERGDPIRDADVRLVQGDMEIAQDITDSSGQYGVFIRHPNDEVYDLFATSGNLGGWQLGFTLREGERRTINLVLRENISIAGSLLMLDDVTPHVSAVVQAIHGGKVIDTTLSDGGGRYQFINLKPGRYQVRCQVLGGYVYYAEERKRKRENEKAGKRGDGDILRVEHGKTLENVDFRFAPFKKGSWRNYTQFDGLAHNWVVDIHRTPDGIMWFGTWGGGVSRYDGKRFVNLTLKDGLAHNQVGAIYRDPDSVMWFGTLGGVSRYDGEQFVNFTTEDGLAGDFVITICRASDGVMWFGTRWDGVSRYDGKQFVNFTVEDGLVHNQVLDIYRDPDGVIWFGTVGGVSRYDGKEFANLTTADGLANGSVAAIYRDPDGIMWFGTWVGGVSRYDGREFVNLNTEDGLAGNNVWAIHRDPDGVMWFGTDGGGVSRYDGEGFVNFTTKDGLTHNSVWAIYRGPDGVMWFGTQDGLSCYDEKRAANFTTRDGLTNNNVVAVHCDPDGVMWFGTWGGGVSRYDGKEFINFTTKDGLAHDVVSAIHRDPDGNIWFGTRGGLSRYDGKEFANLTTADGLAHDTINLNAIYRDPDGVMWIGTDGGVSQYDGENFVNLNAKDGLAGNDVGTIHRDPDGVIWFGLEGNGISRYDGKEFVNFGPEDGLTHEWVTTIHRAVDGRLWVGTTVGAFYLDGTGDVNFVVEDELATGWVYSIYQDLDGTLWFATRYDGACCYNGTEWTSLDKGDGLASNDVRSICRDPDGTLWFGTDNGVTRYRPGSTGPIMRILSITTDQTYQDLSHIPTLQINTRVTVEYDSIDFRTTPEKRQYRCRVYETGDLRPETVESRSPRRDVSGLKSDVPYSPATRETTFDWTPREPGTYTIEAQAIDRDLNYSEPASI